MGTGRTCTATGSSSTVPDHSGSPGFQSDDTHVALALPPSKRTASPSSSRAMSSTMLGIAEPHHAPALARHRGVRPLAGDAALALAQHVVDGGRDRRQRLRRLALRRDGAEAVGKFLGDEAGRELARPASAGCCISAARNGMLWRMPSMAKASSASACAAIAAARVGAWVTSLAIIGS